MVFLNFSAILLFFLSELLKINHPHSIMTTKTSNPLNKSEKAVSSSPVLDQILSSAQSHWTVVRSPKEILNQLMT